LTHDESHGFLGGWPDPLHADWPMCREGPMHFLAQIDLSQLAEAVPDSPLPHDGVLQFFADTAVFLDYEEDCAVAVRHETGDAPQGARPDLPGLGGYNWDHLFPWALGPEDVPTHFRRWPIEMRPLEATPDTLLEAARATLFADVDVVPYPSTAQLVAEGSAATPWRAVQMVLARIAADLEAGAPLPRSSLGSMFKRRDPSAPDPSLIRAGHVALAAMQAIADGQPGDAIVPPDRMQALAGHIAPIQALSRHLSQLSFTRRNMRWIPGEAETLSLLLDGPRRHVWQDWLAQGGDLAAQVPQDFRDRAMGRVWHQEFNPGRIGPWYFWHQALGPVVRGTEAGVDPETHVLLLRITCDDRVGFFMDGEHQPAFSVWMPRDALARGDWQAAFGKLSDVAA
jgi:hypothetical protein